jgi:hypothetical protein
MLQQVPRHRSHKRPHQGQGGKVWRGQYPLSRDFRRRKWLHYDSAARHNGSQIIFVDHILEKPRNLAESQFRPCCILDILTQYERIIKFPANHREPLCYFLINVMSCPFDRSKFPCSQLRTAVVEALGPILASGPDPSSFERIWKAEDRLRAITHAKYRTSLTGTGQPRSAQRSI